MAYEMVVEGNDMNAMVDGITLDAMAIGWLGMA